jgi:mRNA-degrading endonuclease RelE of RelBE toxin-antitoxin system
VSSDHGFCASWSVDRYRACTFAPLNVLLRAQKTIGDQLKQRLVECLKSPHLPSAKFRRSAGRHKIKLKGVVYWLIYEVSDKTVTVLVVAVGHFPDAPEGSLQIIPCLQ